MKTNHSGKALRTLEFWKVLRKDLGEDLGKISETLDINLLPILRVLSAVCIWAPKAVVTRSRTLHLLDQSIAGKRFPFDC